MTGWTAGNSVAYEELCLIDQHHLYQLAEHLCAIEAFYDMIDYASVLRSTIDYIEQTLSPGYFIAIKDALYCGPRDGHRRRSIQTVLQWTGSALVKSLAPVLPFMAEEYFQHHHAEDGGWAFGDAFRTGWFEIPRPWITLDPKVVEVFDGTLKPMLTTVRHLVAEIRSEGYEVTIEALPNCRQALDLMQREPYSLDSEFCEMLSVAGVRIHECDEFSLERDDSVPEEAPFRVAVVESGLGYCERCRKKTVELPGSDVCSRCRKVLELDYPRIAD